MDCSFTSKSKSTKNRTIFQPEMSSKKDKTKQNQIGIWDDLDKTFDEF